MEPSVLSYFNNILINTPAGAHEVVARVCFLCYVGITDVFMINLMTTSTLTDEQLKLRQQVLLILFKEFGNGKYSNQSIYECADEWISKGHKISSGVVKYYDAYYNK